MLGLKYNFNSHRAYILERKIYNKHAKTREGDSHEKSLPGRGTIESKGHKDRKSRSRILEQKAASMTN